MFGEVLPDQCPPADAVDREFKSAFRLVASSTPSTSDFDSYQRMGKTIPIGMNECQWASCSLFVSVPTHLLKIKSILKRFSCIAEVHIPENSGMSLVTNDHIDFWRYSNTDLSNNVLKVMPI